MDKDLKNKTLDELEQITVQLKQKKYLAKYIFTFLHTKDAADISDITPLSKAFRSLLTEQGYYVSQLKTVEKFIDPDGTIKYLFELGDGNRIETVLLFDDDRTTLCISTQVGCAMGCTFCATAKMKFKRDLTAAEILDQVNVVQKDQGRISNIVYMGMGEPLKNYDAVIKAFKILNHPDGKNIGQRHQALSTCGLPDAITKLADEPIRPRLAISLNAPTDSIRRKIMPVANAYPLESLFKAIKLYQLKTHQRVTFEYVLIKGINDSVTHAEALVKKLYPFKCNVNLIEYNPHPGCHLTASSRDKIDRLAKIFEQAGIETTIRLKKGTKIKAACGQLGAAWLKD